MSGAPTEKAPLLLPSGRPEGEVRPPGSKSVAQRLLCLGLLGGHPFVVRSLPESADVVHACGLLRACGWSQRTSGAAVSFRPPMNPIRGGEIDCGQAGTLYRLATAALCVVPGEWRVGGHPRLGERPIGPLVEALRSLGAEIEYLDWPRTAPLLIRGGSLRGGACRLDSGQSSQYLSALLIAGAFAPEPVDIRVLALASRPYVDITKRAFLTVGLSPPTTSGDIYRPARAAGSWPGPVDVTVEADFSAAAYPAAAALIGGGEVSIVGLDATSAQGDRGFLEILTALGGVVEWHGSRVVVRGTIERPVDMDLSAMPDQVPTLAALACFAPGTSRIRNVAHLRVKESDRLRAISIELSKSGFDVREEADGLRIVGRPELVSGPSVIVDPWDDHRIAMCLALVGLRRRGLRLRAPSVVRKSYPLFWADWFRLLGKELPPLEL